MCVYIYIYIYIYHIAQVPQRLRLPAGRRARVHRERGPHGEALGPGEGPDAQVAAGEQPGHRGRRALRLRRRRGGPRGRHHRRLGPARQRRLVRALRAREPQAEHRGHLRGARRAVLPQPGGGRRDLSHLTGVWADLAHARGPRAGRRPLLARVLARLRARVRSGRQQRGLLERDDGRARLPPRGARPTTSDSNMI